MTGQGSPSFGIVNGFVAGMFLVSAALQLNDPDPMPWVLAYLSTAGLGLLAAAGRLPAKLALGWSLALLVFFAWTALTGRGEASMRWGPSWGPLDTEVARELLGLGIAIAWAAVLAWRSRRLRAATA